jgi:predicted Zn-dependent protease
LEAEDWENLITYLEEKVYQKKKFQSQYIRLLINTYLVRSDVESIRKLESFIREQKPELLTKFAVAFGIPYLLQNDSGEMERYYEEFLDKKKNEEGRWIRWNYAFSLYLQKRSEEAKNRLLSLVAETKEPVLQLLNIYLLKTYSEDNRVAETVEHTKHKLTSEYTPQEWEKEVAGAKNDIQVLVLSRLIDEAGNWLFEDQQEQ